MHTGPKSEAISVNNSEGWVRQKARMKLQDTKRDIWIDPDGTPIALVDVMDAHVSDVSVHGVMTNDARCHVENRNWYSAAT